MDKKPYTEKEMARAYVPVQVYTTRYDLMEGFKRGTIFPELDKPYTKVQDDPKLEYNWLDKGEQDNRRKLLRAVQALEFTAIEFNLYLDTHPEDKKALADFNTTCRQLQTVRREYENRYGPLTACGSTPSRYPWPWIEEPWPWEIMG